MLIHCSPSLSLGLGLGQSEAPRSQLIAGVSHLHSENIRSEVVERDRTFDDAKFRSGGIRLLYKPTSTEAIDLKDGVLLEVGFDDVTPNQAADISSWAYDYAADRVDIIDNRALGILRYHPGYTLVEKLQTISTKYRIQRLTGEFPVNFLRHYYDVFCLLGNADVQAFVGSQPYLDHKERRFRSEERNLTINPAFGLLEPSIFAEYERAYESTRSLYYLKRPTFSEIMQRIREFAERL